MRCLLILLLALGLFGCGKTGGGASGARDDAETSTLAGLYRALLLHPGGDLAGTASITVAGDIFEVRLALAGGMGGIRYLGLTKEGDCAAQNPRVLVPFDGDLESQEAGAGRWPGSGARYEERANLALLLDDLTRADADPQDHVVKLERGEGLNLAGRTVTVFGTDGVATFPVACGRVRRVPEEL